MPKDKDLPEDLGNTNESLSAGMQKLSLANDLFF